MSFANIQSLLEKQKVLLSQLIHNNSLIITKSQSILSKTSNSNDSVIYKKLESICDAQDDMNNKIREFHIYDMKTEFAEKVEIKFRMLSGDILTASVCLTSVISEFYHSFLRDNGYNVFIDFVYPIKFIYEDKDGYEKILDHKSGLSWFEIFGTDIPMFNFFIDDISDEKKKKIARETRKYLPYFKLKTDMDDETIYSHYQKWYTTSYNNCGETIFIECNKDLFLKI